MTDRLAVEARYRRVEAKRLAEEQAQPRRALCDIVRAVRQRRLRLGRQLLLQVRLRSQQEQRPA